EDVAAGGVGEPFLLACDPLGAREQVGPVLVLRGRARGLAERLAQQRVRLLQGARGPHAIPKSSGLPDVVQSAAHERTIGLVDNGHGSALLTCALRRSLLAPRVHSSRVNNLSRSADSWPTHKAPLGATGAARGAY